MVRTYWYILLNARGYGAFKSVILTAFVPGPFVNLGFFAFSTAMEVILDDVSGGKNVIDAVKEKIEARWLQTWITSVQLWSLFNYFNFRFVPVEARVLTSSFFSFVWSIYLSVQQHRGSKGDTTVSIPFLWQPKICWTAKGPRFKE